MSPEQEAASVEALRLTGDHHTDYAVVEYEHQSSLAALISTALTGNSDPLSFAEGVLEQLHDELLLVSYLLETNTDLSRVIISRAISGMADRARAAAELSSRIKAANPNGRPKAPTQVSVGAS